MAAAAASSSSSRSSSGQCHQERDRPIVLNADVHEGLHKTAGTPPQKCTSVARWNTLPSVSPGNGSSPTG